MAAHGRRWRDPPTARLGQTRRSVVECVSDHEWSTVITPPSYRTITARLGFVVGPPPTLGCSQLPMESQRMLSRVRPLVVAATMVAGAGAPALAQVERFSERIDQSIAFAPCPDRAGFECGTVTLPIDYERPWAGTFEMAVARTRATGHRIGALFAHPGGHASGLDFIFAGVGAPTFETIRERFDIVSLDPRGVGRTRPVTCGPQVLDPPSDLPDDALIPQLDEVGRRVAEQCLDADRDFVLSIHGTNFARDIDRVRAALGERQWTLVMISNSAPVGAVYARLFPRRVRALVLDSGVGPDFADYGLQRVVDQSGSYEIAFARLAALCRKDTACRLHGEGLDTAYDALFSALTTSPVPGPDGVMLTGADLRGIGDTAVFIESLAAPFVNALADARGGDFARLFQLRALGQSGDSSGSDAIIARLCNDYGTRRVAQDYLPLARAVLGAHPRFAERVSVMSRGSLCSGWPAAIAPVVEPVVGKLSTPILIVGAEFDPAAPFAWTLRLAQALGPATRVVRYQGGGHGLVPRGVPCVRKAVFDYLFNQALPAEGLSCPAVPITFGPPRSAGAVAAPMDAPLSAAPSWRVDVSDTAPVGLRRQ